MTKKKRRNQIMILKVWRVVKVHRKEPRPERDDSPEQLPKGTTQEPYEGNLEVSKIVLRKTKDSGIA